MLVYFRSLSSFFAPQTILRTFYRIRESPCGSFYDIIGSAIIGICRVPRFAVPPLKSMFFVSFSLTAGLPRKFRFIDRFTNEANDQRRLTNPSLVVFRIHHIFFVSSAKLLIHTPFLTSTKPTAILIRSRDCTIA